MDGNLTLDFFKGSIIRILLDNLHESLCGNEAGNGLCCSNIGKNKKKES
jgi:hypothetical protein